MQTQLQLLFLFTVCAYRLYMEVQLVTRPQLAVFCAPALHGALPSRPQVRVTSRNDFSPLLFLLINYLLYAPTVSKLATQLAHDAHGAPVRCVVTLSTGSHHLDMMPRTTAPEQNQGSYE